MHFFRWLRFTRRHFVNELGMESWARARAARERDYSDDGVYKCTYTRIYVFVYTYVCMYVCMYVCR